MKKITAKIKTVADVLKDNGTTQKEFDEKYECLLEHQKANIILELLCKSLNEGWTPDWDDSSEYKYYAWFDMRGGSSGFRCGDYGGWVTDADVGSRLCFETRELAEYAGKQFIEVYREYMTIPEKNQNEILPDFLYEDNGEIRIGYRGDEIVTEEWEEYKKNH